MYENNNKKPHLYNVRQNQTLYYAQCHIRAVHFPAQNV